MTDHNTWLQNWMEKQNIPLWGVADFTDRPTPTDELGDDFPRAVAFALPMDPKIMSGLTQGPTQEYADEYARINKRLQELSKSLEYEIHCRGARALVLAPSLPTTPANIRKEFSHKTAATLAGLGWVGKNCQLITPDFGPWVRLGTVFTAMELNHNQAVTKSRCGDCVRCVEACPAGALKGGDWTPSVLREDLLDLHGCDQWKKSQYAQFAKGHICGICTAVCPFGTALLKD
ncbi:MAG: hypothetical protein MI749_05155 [Desulfovibrionales bacterium]|nr:hypothetical protein [Desulfovibrionales bacterium]